MTKQLVVAVVFSVAILTGQLSIAGNVNSLTEAESTAGFESLFDGKSLGAGWEHKGNWKVEDGAITREGQGGSLVYKAKKIPDDFELRFQWKVAKGSNSGVYYRPGQYEYQILDNSVHADGKNPRTSAASLYFCMAPSHDATKPVGEWNKGRIVCKGTVIQHWLNGKKVIHFDYSDSKWAFNVDMLEKRGAKLPARGANLSLQDHGNPVWYQAIKLRKLPANEKLNMDPVNPAKIADEILEAERKKLEGIVNRRKK
ncbi:MAG: DUF1080 domain-containing protein [Planctomycetaceae bacterium]|jgi:hypothetical protein|nr:DUF1080 domain-containing protein [Planctomycetaceae bacterium]MBT4844667.1 DUF1080 domain-containing protein [Planctomycetaceae bacterium]MBT5598225.1 DUF1080 domain-containing protein [Planctomycetaceae bacterium]MBT5883089.1 DUF1080 domain-containing protein [Planctomycetaceae bacterium]MBT6848166.1 DUF1080 domain-containing protein [Planctomycetaceae bacterium]